MKTPILLHIPHSSLNIPKAVRDMLCVSEAELERELLRMTDRYTDILFDLPTITNHSIIYPVSRLVVDPERFEDDAMELMAAIGMGVIYTATSQKISCAPNRMRVNAPNSWMLITTPITADLRKQLLNCSTRLGKP